MSFFLLINKGFTNQNTINKLVKQFELAVHEYNFSDLKRNLYVFTWKSKETAHDEGKIEGKIEEKLEIAINSHKAGISLEVISQITGLEIDEVKTIVRDISNDS